MMGMECELLRNMCILVSAYYFFIPLLRIVYNQYIGSVLFSKRKALRKYGSWAVVTGSTDGIGQAYAEELASDGFNIVLISRTAEKLADVANEIMGKYKVSAKTIAVDFTKVDIYNSIQKELEGLDIGVLVNNVGMSYQFPNYFDQEFPANFFENMVNCNMTSVVLMTRIVLPGMVTRAKGGAVINISSASGTNPTPMLAAYGASKAFVDFFSRSVGFEVRRHGITFQCVMPFFVATKMSRLRPSLAVPTPKHYVRSALSLVGVEERTFGCFSHSIQGLVTGLVPEFILNKVTMSMLCGTRERYLKRYPQGKTD